MNSSRTFWLIFGLLTAVAVHLAYILFIPQSQLNDRIAALISEAGALVPECRWVREGTRIGDFVLQEIHRNKITCRTDNGDQIHELAVNHGSSNPIVARRHKAVAQAASGADVMVSDANHVIAGVP